MKVVGGRLRKMGSAETVQMESVAAPAGETERLEISAVADAPATERLRATTAPKRPATRRPGMRRFSWRTIAATAAIVFVLALMFITAIELISGKPLSAIFGGSDTGTTLRDPTSTPESGDANHDHVDHSTTRRRRLDHDDDEHHRAHATSTTTTSPASSTTTTTGASATTTTSTSSPPP